MRIVAATSTLLLLCLAAAAHAEPQAGSLALQLRYEDQTTFSDTGAVLGISGFEVGLGERLTDRWYLGATGEIGLGMNVSDVSNGATTSLRAGGEARYVFHHGTATTLDDDGNVTGTLPRVDYVGVRGGAQSVNGADGGFGELELGGNAWLGTTTQLGLFVNLGINVEPPDAYGTPVSPLGNSAPPPAPTSSSPVVSPYFTGGVELAFG